MYTLYNFFLNNIFTFFLFIKLLIKYISLLPIDIIIFCFLQNKIVYLIIILF